MPNQLVNATSPYLLQHADNPVDWHPWGNEALDRAKQEDKPIFLSIGYAACHWCHVMAHESFEDPQLAALMNEHFVNIKVDREERPDLDSIYMAAVVALSGQGGWPMSVFLSPDLRPFYGGTYFPPTARYGKPAFRDVLLTMAKAWKERRQEIDKAAEQISEHLQKELVSSAREASFTAEMLKSATKRLVETYDWQYGGWGAAPKFPQPMAIELLLRRHNAGDDQALKPAMHALQHMMRGGMYDVVGGGFARYSTDNHWLVPHFEKMLYDNAQLARAYLHAWQLTGESHFLQVVEATLDFVSREMLDDEGGFYSSLDADAEGEEGKFYVWTEQEIREVLGEEFGLFKLAYDITEHGNWEGKMVLQRALDDEALAIRFGLSSEQVNQQLRLCHALLLERREQRVRPATDDKVLMGWNGLMLATFAEAGRVLGNQSYQLTAQKNAEFLLSAMRADGRLRRAWRAGKVGNQVFLEDYAALILGLIELYQMDFDVRWFIEARDLAGQMLQRFSDPAGGFFDTPHDSEKLLIKPKDIQDNATPSGNALAVEALLKLAALDDRSEWRAYAERSLAQVAHMAERHPTAFARWLGAVDFALNPTKQVAIIGELDDPNTKALLKVVASSYRPNLVLAASVLPLPVGSPALLEERTMVDGKPTAYVCEGFVCRMPATQMEQLSLQID